MDWIKQTQDVMTSWADAQQQMMNGWMDLAAKQGQEQTVALWKQSLEVYESALARTMEAQAAWVDAWTAQMKNVDGLPAEAKQQVEHGEKLLRQWMAMQQQLLQAGFDAAKKVDPTEATSAWQHEAKSMFDAWQRSVQEMTEQGQHLFRAATEAATETAETAAGSNGKG